MKSLQAGRNCWRIAEADRLAFLIDAEAYFERLVQALEQAERSVWIIGWDLHSRVALRRGPDGPSHHLGALLDRLARRKRQLRIRLLNWDFAAIYAPARESFPLVRLGWRTHRRVQFASDAAHPVGAAHHQKLVVIDDRLAFVGGLDLCARRWDTPEHAADDPRRIDPDGNAYRPFHDIQVAVAGPAARDFGDLARERWRRATGKRVQSTDIESTPWPAGLEPDLEAVSIGIARTEGACDGRPEVREIERYYTDAIAAARRTIYLENQYFTSAAIAEALEARLNEADGPEVVVVTTRRAEDWLEEATMTALRARLIHRLGETRHADRLRVYYPYRKALGETSIIVHAKLAVFDERRLTVGSANLSNRSMGFDSECNLCLEASDDAPQVGRAIARLRDRMLAEHLGLGRDDIPGSAPRDGALIPFLEAHRERGADRRLEPLDPTPLGEHELDEVLVSSSALFDPERPIDGDTLLARVLPQHGEGYRPTWLPLGGSIAGVAWLLFVLGGIVNGRVAEILQTPEGATRLGLAVAASWVVGSLLMTPIVLLLWAGGVWFGFGAGVAIGAAGILLAAAETWLAGRLLGRNRVRRLHGFWISRIDQSRRRVLGTVAAMRLRADVPFASVSMTFGAAGERAGPVVAGSLLGKLPVLFAIPLAGDLLARALARPGLVTGLWATAAVGLAVVVIALARRLGRRTERELRQR